ncbi:MAG TPA: histidine phosphatase family protein [Actinospica sp.]|nr:histidine phosphatase family protein [Actinospica sp.]
MTELVLVRHGQAVDNVEFLMNLTPLCRGLTERGHEQAELLAARLAKQMTGPRPFDAVYHSPTRRAAETTEHVVAAIGPNVPVEALDGLRVADHGVEGQHPWDPKTNLIGTLPPLDPENPPAPGAESWQGYLERSGRTLLGIAGRHEGGRILVVAHAETSASAMHTFMRLPVGASRWTFPLINHTSLSGWRHSHSPYPGADPAGSWAIMYVNDDSHLPESERVYAL